MDEMSKVPGMGTMGSASSCANGAVRGRTVSITHTAFGSRFGFVWWGQSEWTSPFQKEFLWFVTDGVADDLVYQVIHVKLALKCRNQA